MTTKIISTKSPRLVWLKLEILTSSDAGKHVEKVNSDTLYAEMSNGPITLENCWVHSHMIKLEPTLYSSNSTPRFLLQKNENICPQETHRKMFTAA